MLAEKKMSCTPLANGTQKGGSLWGVENSVAYGGAAKVYYRSWFGGLSKANINKFQAAPNPDFCDLEAASGFQSAGMNAAMADGSVRFLSVNMSSTILPEPGSGTTKEKANPHFVATTKKYEKFETAGSATTVRSGKSKFDIELSSK